MKDRPKAPTTTRKLWLGIALASSTVFLAWACGGDGRDAPATLEEYFRQVEAVIADFGAGVDGLQDPSEAETEVRLGYIETFVGLLRRSVEELRDIEALPDVARVHEEAVQAREGVAEATEALIELSESAESEAQPQAEFLQSHAATSAIEAGDRSIEACFALQSVADDAGIDVELQCRIFTVEGASMEPSFPNLTHVRVRQLGREPPERGDVIVFRPPHDPNREFIKRIIGLPGDILEIDEANGVVSINGNPFDDPNVIGPVSCMRTSCRWEIPMASTAESRQECGADACYFVIGDNTQNSSDSRQGWLLPDENIVGRAVGVSESPEGRPRW